MPNIMPTSWHHARSHTYAHVDVHVHTSLRHHPDTQPIRRHIRRHHVHVTKTSRNPNVDTCTHWRFGHVLVIFRRLQDLLHTVFFGHFRIVQDLLHPIFDENLDVRHACTTCNMPFLYVYVDVGRVIVTRFMFGVGAIGALEHPHFLMKITAPLGTCSNTGMCTHYTVSEHAHITPRQRWRSHIINTSFWSWNSRHTPTSTSAHIDDLVMFWSCFGHDLVMFRRLHHR